MYKQTLQLSWRNIWRNKRRALLTMSSVALSLFFVLILRQTQFWAYDFNIRNTVSAQIGYLQITDSLYVDEEILDHSMTADQIPEAAILALPGVTELVPRFNAGALISTGLSSRFAGVLGIDPRIDNQSLKLDRKLSAGTLLNPGDPNILITDKMAEFYQVKPGDSLVVIGMGYQGQTAVGIYAVRGIIDFPVGPMSNMVYMDINEAQYLFAAPERHTHFLVNLEAQDDQLSARSRIQALLKDRGLQVRTWQEVLPGLQQALAVDAYSGLLMAGILYMIVAFGMFGTIVMMHNERQYELGVMSAIGMSDVRLIAGVLIELLILTLLGIAAGLLLAYPVLYHFNQHPILIGGEAAQGAIEQGFEPYLGMGLYPSVFLANALTIALIALVVSLYMIYKLWRINPIEAMKHA